LLSNSLIKVGRLKDAENVCLKVLEKYKDIDYKTIPIFMLYVPLGLCYFENDNLSLANKYLYEGVKVCSQTNLLQIFGEGEWHLALYQYATGDFKAALETIKKAKLSADQNNMIKAIETLEAIEIDLYLKEGFIEPGINWVKNKDFSSNLQIKPYMELQYLTYVRILIHQGHYQAALKVLSKLEESTKEGSRNQNLMIVHILQAIIMKKIKNDNESAQYMSKAVYLASYHEYYGVFLNEGLAVAEILPMVKGTAPAFVESLLKKFSERHFHKINISSKTKESSLDQYSLLTKRENEILKLISLGLSNKEIASKLFITIGTTKCHITSIYSKLGVARRTQAIAKAKELGFI